MKSLLLVCTICLFSPFVYGQSFNIDSFLQDTFVHYLIENGFLSEANLHLKEKILAENLNKNEVSIMLDWFLLTKQPMLLVQYGNPTLLTIEDHQKQKNILKSLIKINQNHRAKNLCYYWNYEEFKPALSLINAEQKNYLDSFYGIYPALDSLYLNHQQNKSKGKLATAISLVPGLGKIYLGRAYDGLGTLSIISILALQGYEQHRSDALAQYPYFFMAGMFYISSIYGTHKLKTEIAKNHEQLFKEHLLFFIDHL